MSVDLQFSRKQKMRYMNKVVNINETLKTQWCLELKEFDSYYEKVMFAFTRFIDAYHLKARRQSSAVRVPIQALSMTNDKDNILLNG